MIYSWLLTMLYRLSRFTFALLLALGALTSAQAESPDDRANTAECAAYFSFISFLFSSKDGYEQRSAQYNEAANELNDRGKKVAPSSDAYTTLRDTAIGQVAQAARQGDGFGHLIDKYDNRCTALVNNLRMSQKTHPGK